MLACRPAQTDEPGTGASAARRGGEDGGAVVLPCLGALSAAELIGAAAETLGDLTLVSAGCETCRERAAGLAVDAAIDTAVSTVATLGGRLTVERHTAPRAAAGAAPDAPAGPALSRRDLFAFLARGARRAAAEGLASQRRTIADLHGQAPPPAGHARLLADIATLAARGDAGVATAPVAATPVAATPVATPPVATTSAATTSAAATPPAATPPARSLPTALPMAILEMGPGCTGCDLCVRYCPHAALALAGGVPRCDESLCTGCGLCVEVCPPGALALRPAAVGPLPAASAGVP